MKTGKTILIFAVAALITAASAPKAMALPDAEWAWDRYASAVNHTRVGDYENGYYKPIPGSSVSEAVGKAISKVIDYFKSSKKTDGDTNTPAK
jgi:hypothetical protein